MSGASSSTPDPFKTTAGTTDGVFSYDKWYPGEKKDATVHVRISAAVLEQIENLIARRELPLENKSQYFNHAAVVVLHHLQDELTAGGLTFDRSWSVAEEYKRLRNKHQREQDYVRTFSCDVGVVTDPIQRQALIRNAQAFSAEMSTPTLKTDLDKTIEYYTKLHP